MLLVMDVGNSHIALGVFDGDDLRAHWRLVTAHDRTSDELRVLLLMLLQQEALTPAMIDGCCISSVVPPLNRALQQVSREGFGVEPLMVGPGIKTGLVIQYANPKEVGADRIVNAVAAIDKYSGPLILVDFGTATTFDGITAESEYRGGVIVPGIRISADALFEHCAKLPRVEIVRPKEVIGRDTVSSICSGLTYGYADLVDGVVGRMKACLGGKAAVIATGGLAEVIAEVATSIDVIDQELTLNGLRIIYHRNERHPA